MSDQNDNRTDLDQQQIFQRSFDPTSDRIRVDAALSASIIVPPGLEVAINSVDDNIAIRNSNNSNELLINSDGSLNSRQNGTYNITNISGIVSLPTGAATESTLSLLNGKIPSNLTVSATRLLVDNSGVTQPISAASLPLPIGASTSANQTNGLQKSQIVDASGNVWGPRTGLSSVNYMPIINLEAASDGAPIALRTLQIGGSDGVNLRNISTDITGKLNINNISGIVSLPTNAATETTLSSLNTKVTTTANGIKVDSSNSVVPFQTRSDIFSATGNGVIINTSTSPLKYFSLQVTISGSVTAWDIILEGSLDGISFTRILQHTESTGDTVTIFPGASVYPILYFRSRCSVFTGSGGDSLTATIMGMQ